MARAVETLVNGYAPGTRNNLICQKAVYFQFCNQLSFQVLPFMVDKLLLYIQFLSERSYKPEVIKTTFLD